MGSAYDFNLLMYFLALRIGTRCFPRHIFVGLPTILPKIKSWLLSFTVLKRMQKRVVTKEFVRKLRGPVSQNLISDLVRTSFRPPETEVKLRI